MAQRQTSARVQRSALVVELPSSFDKLEIVYFPDPVLRERCRSVEVFDDRLAGLARRMEVLMQEASGVGLAAPQVGIPFRMFICNATGEPEDAQVWVNPVLSGLEGLEEAEEGCLSIPGVTVLKRRAGRAVIDGFDLKGRAIRGEASELVARIWQHELDHLDGVLVIDGMSEASEIANRKAIRQLEADYADAMRRRRR